MTPIVMRWRGNGCSEWLAADGSVREGLPAPAEDMHLTVLVPGEDVVLLEIPRVAKSVHQLEQAVPFAVEEQLVAPIEQQHVAWSVSADGQRVQVLVAFHERMAAWLSPLREAGLEPDVMVPDVLALPVAERPHLLVESGRGLLRWGNFRALAIESESLPALAAQLPSPVDVWLLDGGDVPLPVNTLQRPASVLSALAEGARRPLVNLLQGNYAPHHRTRGLQQGWRVAAMLGVAALLLVFLSAVVDRQKLSAKVAAQESEMAALYLRAVPDAGNVDNPAQQLQSVLASQGLGQGDVALSLLAKAAPALAADARVSLESLDYREGRLELVLQAADVAGLDALRQRLVAAGLPAEITGSTPGTQGVQGRLRIGGAR